MTHGGMLRSHGDRLQKLETVFVGGSAADLVKPEPGENERPPRPVSSHATSNTTEGFAPNDTPREREESVTETAPSPADAPPLAAPPDLVADDERNDDNEEGEEGMEPSDIQPIQPMAEDELEAEPGPPVPPGEPAIPINHTTLAGLLLEWPAIRDLTQDHLVRHNIHFVNEFPIRVEQNRGALNLTGRGEDTPWAVAPQEVPDHSTADNADDSSDMTSPSPTPGHGLMTGLSPPDAIEYKSSVLNADGNPDFSEAKVWTYVESFKEHILNMHPIIQPKVLDSWVKHFLDSMIIAQSRTGRSTASRGFAVSGSSQEVTGTKRKRSPERDGHEWPNRNPDNSVHSALILIILALGKVCQYRERIPDAVHTLPEVGPQDSPRHPVATSPIQGSPPGVAPAYSGFSSPKEPERNPLDRRVSGQNGAVATATKAGFNLKRNYDVVPGLEYFARAASILGQRLGAHNNMKIVYAYILAALYYGQLERPIESHCYLSVASHKLLIVLRPYALTPSFQGRK